jgi:hypothetical protein
MTRERQRVYLVTTAIVLVVLALGGVWWNRVRQNPNRVFWDMLANNLSTSGVTRAVIQKGQGVEISQYTQLSFGGQPQAHALTVFSSKSSTLATEEISDQTHDFVRYQRIDLPGKKLNAAGVLGKWAQLDSGQSVDTQLTSGLFNQSLIDVLPFANLSAADRGKLLGTMHDQQAFTYNKNLVKKTSLQGRQVYLYAVSIHPAAYIRIMQQFESLIGATTYASLRPSDAAKTKPIAIVVSVDARSHELSQLYQASVQRTTTYGGFGIVSQRPLPQATITTTELTRRLGQLN